MFVEVCLTMTAFSSESTTCSVEPVTVIPVLGSTMRTTAGEDGREPIAELVGLAEPLDPGPPQATSAAPAIRLAASHANAGFTIGPTCDRAIQMTLTSSPVSAAGRQVSGHRAPWP